MDYKKVVYQEKYDTKDNQDLVARIAKEFKFEFERAVKCPPSWADEVYSMLRRIKMLVQDIHFQGLYEKKGTLVLNYTTTRTAPSYVDGFVNDCRKKLVLKGVHPKPEDIKRCPHCKGIL